MANQDGVISLELVDGTKVVVMSVDLLMMDANDVEDLRSRVGARFFRERSPC